MIHGYGVIVRPHRDHDEARAWVYKRVASGGLWVLLLLLPIMKGRIIPRGILFSFLPSALMLFMILPSMAKGMPGLGFATLMPVAVALLHFIYGIFASFCYSKIVS